MGHGRMGDDFPVTGIDDEEHADDIAVAALEFEMDTSGKELISMRLNCMNLEVERRRNVFRVWHSVAMPNAR